MSDRLYSKKNATMSNRLGIREDKIDYDKHKDDKTFSRGLLVVLILVLIFMLVGFFSIMTNIGI